MIDPGPNLVCRQAKQYYYDFLCSESREPIPEFITDHIQQCRQCQEQIGQLEAVLSEAGGTEPEQGQAGSAITVMLSLHFAYIGKQVTCNTVKPFLPGLLDPSLEVRIPTPITAHLDNCPRCSEDLETIRALNLNRQQLHRLSRLFADKPAWNDVSCSEARAAILAAVLIAFRQTDAEVLKHLCICPDCRKSLYEYREQLCEEYRLERLHSTVPQEEFPCEEVSGADIFDCAVPYGLDLLHSPHTEFRESFISHARSCPTCLGKMQELHETVYEVRERPESEIATIYDIDESAKAKAVGEPDGLYSGFPIKVQVLNREDGLEANPSASTISFTASLKRKLSAVNPRLLVKTGIAAAAILIVAALLLNMPTAEAVTIEGIYKAIEKVKNVYIASFVPNETEPTQEKWVSRTLNIYMTKTGKELVLCDVSSRLRRNKSVDTAVTETMSLSDDAIADVERRMSGSLGLMPFYDVSEIPQDAEWSRVTNDGSKAVAKGTEVYDLIWERYRGSVTFKWRAFVDPKAILPQRIEFYQKLSADSEYTLMSVKVVKYLSDSEIQAVIGDASF